MGKQVETNAVRAKIKIEMLNIVVGVYVADKWNYRPFDKFFVTGRGGGHPTGGRKAGFRKLKVYIRSNCLPGLKIALGNQTIINQQNSITRNTQLFGKHAARRDECAGF